MEILEISCFDFCSICNSKNIPNFLEILLSIESLKCQPQDKIHFVQIICLIPIENRQFPAQNDHLLALSTILEQKAQYWPLDM